MYGEVIEQLHRLASVFRRDPTYLAQNAQGTLADIL
jgi:hypothetical protein